MPPAHHCNNIIFLGDDKGESLFFFGLDKVNNFKVFYF